MSTTYFLYARKSTDVEDKQVRSIEDQLAVLHDLAKHKGLHIAHEFVEKQSAKRPDRYFVLYVFGGSLQRSPNLFYQKSLIFAANLPSHWGSHSG